MRAKLFIILLIAVVCMLGMDGFIYAAERGAAPYGSGRPLGPSGANAAPPIQTPEPSTLILLGMGATGIYLYSRRTNNKN